MSVLAPGSTNEVVMAMSGDGRPHPPWMPCRHPPSFGGWTLHREPPGWCPGDIKGAKVFCSRCS